MVINVTVRSVWTHRTRQLVALRERDGGGRSKVCVKVGGGQTGTATWLVVGYKWDKTSPCSFWSFLKSHSQRDQKREGRGGYSGASCPPFTKGRGWWFRWAASQPGVACSSVAGAWTWRPGSLHSLLRSHLHPRQRQLPFRVSHGPWVPSLPGEPWWWAERAWRRGLWAQACCQSLRAWGWSASGWGWVVLAGSLGRGWRGLLLEQSHLNKDGIKDKGWEQMLLSSQTTSVAYSTCRAGL